MILGIDSGIEHVGWCLLHDSGEIEDFGVLYTSPKDKQDTRLRKIQSHFAFILQGNTLMYYETIPPVLRVKGQVQVGNQLKVSEALGVIKAEVLRLGGSCVGVTARSAKLRLTGDSEASKSVVKASVLELYPELDREKRFDAYDAVAVAHYGRLKYGVVEKEEEKND